MKKCRECGFEKELSDFYKHKKMKDGHLNICKDCTKKRVGSHRLQNLDRIRNYDRERGKLPHRKKQNTERTRRIRREKPGYYSAHQAIANAIKSGRIKKPQKCAWCGREHSQIEGHHEDYRKPLDVIWLCSPCHKIYHLGKGGKIHAAHTEMYLPEVYESR